jgi:large repetitive protein
MLFLHVRAAPGIAAARWTAVVFAAALMLVAPAFASADEPTATAITLPVIQPVHGQTATLTATVDDTTTPATVPLGSVQFYLDGSPIGAAVALTGHTAQVQTPALAAGTHPVRAAYIPSAGFIASEGTASLTVARATTTTLLRITPATTGVTGQDLAVEAAVTPAQPALGSPTGAVSFFVNGQKLGDDTLDGDGVSRGTVELPAVSITIVVTYSGDNHYAGSSSSTAVTVNRAGTVIALSASPNPAFVNQTVTFSLMVDSVAPSMWWPSGDLSSAVDGQPVPGAITLDGTGGTAQFTRTFASAGAHHITAHFAGDEDFLAADAALDETVNALATTPASPKPATRTAARGLSVKVAPKRDRRSPYRFTISGSLQLPSSVTKADGCSGKVTVEAKLKTKRVARKTAALTSACRFKTTVTAPRKGAISIAAKFAGNATIAAVSAHAVKVTAG